VTATIPVSRPYLGREEAGVERPVIVDGRNLVDPDAWICEGFVYKGIGRGDRNRHPPA
jgi:UDP-N-acetyl-D-mannosaminuronic acid dehydrogenase